MTEYTYPTRQVMATARDAGRNVVHTVTARYADGRPAPVYRGVRRSATNRYAFAICEWATDSNGDRAVFVSRWSKSPKAGGGKFAVAVEDEV